MLEVTKTPKKNASVKKQPTPTQNSNKKSTSIKTQPMAFQITQEQRQHMIEEAAYFIAEHQGFLTGSSFDNWLAAEAEIDKQLAQMEG